MKRLSGFLLAGIIALAAVAATGASTTKWTCTLTGKTVEKCCCIPQKDGKLYCTLAKKTVDSCCCKAAAQ